MNSPQSSSNHVIRQGDTAISRRLILRNMLCALGGYGWPAYSQSSGPQKGLENSPLLVYIVPQFPSEDIFRGWSPVLKKLGEKLGVLFSLKIARSIPEFEQLFLAGVPDIAYLNPYHAVMARRSAAYEPIIYDASHGLSGVLLVKRDSPYQKLADLQNKELAFPAPNAFGASLLMRALLIEKEHLSFSARYVHTHTNVFRQIITGQVAAGGAVRQTLELESSFLREKLRIVYETAAYPSHPIVVHPRVPETLRHNLRMALLEIAQDPQATKMLARIHLSQPKVATYQLYQPLERMGLEKYLFSAASTTPSK